MVVEETVQVVLVLLPWVQLLRLAALVILVMIE